MPLPGTVASCAEHWPAPAWFSLHGSVRVKDDFSLPPTLFCPLWSKPSGPAGPQASSTPGCGFPSRPPSLVALELLRHFQSELLNELWFLNSEHAMQHLAMAVTGHSGPCWQDMGRKDGRMHVDTLPPDPRPATPCGCCREILGTPGPAPQPVTPKDCYGLCLTVPPKSHVVLGVLFSGGWT